MKGARESTAKREKFVRLAESRTANAMRSIRVIGNLSNRQLYAWEDAEVRKIVKALRDEISKIEARFEAPNSRRRQRFSL